MIINVTIILNTTDSNNLLNIGGSLLYYTSTIYSSFIVF